MVGMDHSLGWHRMKWEVKKQQLGESFDIPDLKLKRPGFGRAQVLDQLIQGQFNRSMTTV